MAKVRICRRDKVKTSTCVSARYDYNRKTDIRFELVLIRKHGVRCVCGSYAHFVIGCVVEQGWSFSKDLTHAVGTLEYLLRGMVVAEVIVNGIAVASHGALEDNEKAVPRVPLTDDVLKFQVITHRQ